MEVEEEDVEEEEAAGSGGSYKELQGKSEQQDLLVLTRLFGT